MSALEKSILFHMLLERILKSVIYPRGSSKSIGVSIFTARKQAFKQTNYILAAIDEELKGEEIVWTIK